MSSYAVVIERATDGGLGAWCPDLPGCVALADTEDALLAEMRQAIELHLAGLREDGQPVPHPQPWPRPSLPSTRPDGTRSHARRASLRPHSHDALADHKRPQATEIPHSHCDLVARHPAPRQDTIADRHNAPVSHSGTMLV